MQVYISLLEQFRQIFFLELNGRLIKALKQSLHTLASGRRHTHCLDVAKKDYKK